MSVFRFIHSDGHVEYHDVWPNWFGGRKPPPPVYFRIKGDPDSKNPGIKVFKLRAEDGQFFYIEKVNQ